MYKGVSDNQLNLLVIAVLVQKLGGKVTVTQQEIDQVAYNRLIDEFVNNELHLTVEIKTSNG